MEAEVGRNQLGFPISRTRVVPVKNGNPGLHSLDSRLRGSDEREEKA
jgi:hypothetical protein